LDVFGRKTNHGISADTYDAIRQKWDDNNTPFLTVPLCCIANLHNCGANPQTCFIGQKVGFESLSQRIKEHWRSPKKEAV